MDHLPTLPDSLRLDKKALHSLADGVGIVVTCAEGAVWLTLDGDARDFVLEAGQTFEAQEHGRILIYALAPSRVSLAAAAPASTRTRYSRKTTMLTFSRFQAMPLRNAMA